VYRGCSRGNVGEDLLSITAVHSTRREAVIEFLKRAKADWHVIEELLQQEKLTEIDYYGKKYYMRKLPVK
jgi:hypothetical protein